MNSHRKLRLLVHPWRLQIRKLSVDTPITEAAAQLPAAGFASLVRSSDSLTLVHEVPTDSTAAAWRAIEVAGSFAFDETGVLAAIAAPLAQAGVSIFAVNSYETDFVLVQEADLERARSAVAQAGHLLG
jgi:hypothetical protein